MSKLDFLSDLELIDRKEHAKNCAICKGTLPGKFPLLKMLVETLQLQDETPELTRFGHERLVTTYYQNCLRFPILERPALSPKDGNA